MARVVVITANYGSMDCVRPQAEQDIAVDWVCVTDQPSFPPLPWRSAPRKAAVLDPRLAAKTAKMTPWDVIPGYDFYIWIDASMEVTSPSFAREALEDLGDAPVAVWRHPRRDCVYEEAAASVGAESQGKYDPVALAKQTGWYAECGLQPHSGLYACGTVAWNMAHPGTSSIGYSWLNENDVWSVQDQLSLPFVFHMLGGAPALFRHDQMDGWDPRNPWLRIHPHLR